LNYGGACGRLVRSVACCGFPEVHGLNLCRRFWSAEGP